MFTHQHRPDERASGFWLWEVWSDNRETLKVVAGDALCFAVLMSVLSVGHHLVARMPLPPEDLAFIEIWHFRIVVAAWLWLGLVLFVEIVTDSSARIYRRVGKVIPRKSRLRYREEVESVSDGEGRHGQVPSTADREL